MPRVPIPVAALLLAALLPAAALGQSADSPEAARPIPPREAGPQKPTAESVTPESMGIATTEALEEEQPGPRPPLEPGLGMSRQPPVDEALEQLREASVRIEKLRAGLLEVAAARGQAEGTPLGEQGQKILIDAKLAVQMLEHSRAVPDWSQDIQDTLETISESQRLLIEEPAEAAANLVVLGEQLEFLMVQARQALAAEPQEPGTAAAD